MERSLLDRMASLETKADDERKRTLDELHKALNPGYHSETNTTKRQDVLKNKAVMNVLINLSASTSPVGVAENAFSVLQRLAGDGDNRRWLFQEHPSLVPVAMRKLEFGAGNTTESVQIKALEALRSLALNVDNGREMAIKNPTLVSLLIAKVESNLEQLQEGALSVLRGLAENDDNKREMATKNPKLVPLLVAKAKSNSEQVQVEALNVLRHLAGSVDNGREMITKTPTLVSLLMAKAESDSENVQMTALGVLYNLAYDDNNAREMVTKNPTLITLLVAKAGIDSEYVQGMALGVLSYLALNDDSAREMATQNSRLIPLLMVKLKSNSEQAQVKALIVLYNLATNVDNAAEMMATSSALLLPLLVAKMNGNTCLQATKVIYHLSCPLANHATLRGNNSVATALAKGRENQDEGTSFVSLLALINLFGAEEDSNVLKTDLEMLQEIFELIARAMNKDGWSLNNPLLAFRYLCVVEHNRQLLWSKYGSKFLTRVLAAHQRAIEDSDTVAAENAMSTLAQFSNDTEPSAWMCSNKLQLDQIIAQLARFPKILKMAQFLQFTLDPPKVVAAPVTSSKPTIMISYNWKHQAQARLIHSLLESQGYPVWRDEQDMKGSIMDAMTDAVSKSTVVLVLVSSFYKESVGCKLECLFAHNNNRKLIPVLVEPGYVFEADGWLSVLFGNKLYYDVSGSQMEPVIFNLLRNEVEGSRMAATAAPPVATAPKQPVPQNEVEIVDKLTKEELVGAKDLEQLSKKNATELKALIDLSANQALMLEAALKELYAQQRAWKYLGSVVLILAILALSVVLIRLFPAA